MRKSLCIVSVIAIFSTGALATVAGAAPMTTKHAQTSAARHRAPAPQPFGEITSFSSSSAPTAGTNHPPKK